MARLTLLRSMAWATHDNSNAARPQRPPPRGYAGQMTSIQVLVRVDGNEQDSLLELERLQCPGEAPSRITPFDGETLIQSLLTITVATWPFFRAWLKERVDHRRAVSVIHEGIEIRGYTAKELDSLLPALDRLIAVKMSDNESPVTTYDSDE